MRSDVLPGPYAQTIATVDADNPWPGPEAFREADAKFFFGRTLARDRLTELVLQSPLVILYGRSGLGKTSLLCAGVFPKLREAQALPVYIRLNFASPLGSDAEGLRSQVKQAIETVAADAAIEAPTLDPAVTLWEWFYRADAAFFNERSRRVRPVLVFDQFEEAFTHGRATSALAAVSHKFLRELVDLVRGSIPPEVAERLQNHPAYALDFKTGRSPCGVLLALRREFLAELLRLRSDLPALLDARYELFGMTIDEAELVVTGPGAHLVERGVAPAVASFVAAARRSAADETTDDTTVDPAILSIFCRELNNSRRSRKLPRITTELVAGTQDSIIADFYDHSVSDVSPELRRFIEDRLVTDSGYRNSAALEEALQTEGVTAEAIDQLIERRLLRREGAGHRARIELTHDVLTEPIIKSRDHRRMREHEEAAQRARELEKDKAREALERELKDRELKATVALLAKTQEHAALRKRAIVIGTLLASFLIVVLWLSYRRSREDADRTTAALASAHLEQGFAQTAGGRRDLGLASVARALRVDPGNTAARSLAFDAVLYDQWPLPERVHRHSGAVTSAQFSANGSRLVTASLDHTARVWDDKGNPIGSPLAHPQGVLLARFGDDDGRTVLTLSADGVARVWDVASGAETERLEHAARILWAAVARRGGAIATGDEEGTLRIWRGAPSKPIRAHRGALLAASFNPDGTRLVTSSSDGTAKIWDVNTGRETAHLVGHRDAVVWARFSPDGQRIATASRDGTARLWEPPYRVATHVLSHENAVVGVEFSPDGTRLVTAYGKGARLWDARNGQQMAEIPHEHDVVSAAFAADGVRLLTASVDKTVRISSAFDGRAIGERLHLESALSAASFSPDSRRIVTAAEDGTATVWDVSAGAAIPMTIRSGCSAPAITFHQAESEVTVGCPEGRLTSYKMATGEVASPAVSDPEWSGLSQLAYGAENRLAIVSGGKLFLRPRSGGAATPLAHKASVVSLEMAPNGQMLVTVTADNSLHTWDVRTAQPLMTFENDGRIAAVHFSPNSTEVIAALGDGTARILQANTGGVLGGVLQRQGGPLVDARISRDGRQLLTLTEGGTAKLWDRRGTEIKAFPTLSRAIRFSPTDDLVLTLQDAPQLWDRAGNAVATLSADVPAMAAEFSRDGRRIVTTNSSSSVVIWDPRTGQRHSEPRSLGDAAAAFGTTAMLSPDGQKVAVISNDGTLRITDVPEGSADDAAPLAGVLDVLARLVINEHGAIVRIEDPARRLAELRADVSRTPPRILGERVRAWAVHDFATRTITPFRTETVPAYIEAQLGSDDENARREIQRLFPWWALPSVAGPHPSAGAPKSK